MAKTPEQIHAAEQKELAKWEAEKAKPWKKGYYGYLLVILSIIYIMDEVTSGIRGSVQSSIINEFFVIGRGMDYNEGLAAFGVISIIVILINVLAPFYKTLSDRYGRKIFLALNTIGMGTGLLICYTSNSFVVYIAGVIISTFFTAHDMQAIYIMETAPKKLRGTVYASIKCIASLGVVFIPVLRTIFMGEDPTQWRAIFLIPGVLGFVIGIWALLSAKETPYFLERRIAFLKSTPEDRAKEAKEEGLKKENGKGGIGKAFRFMFQHKQLRGLVFANILFFFAVGGINNYESIMTIGGMSTVNVTQALFVYPFVNAFITLISGILADKIGRKKVAVTISALSITTFILFILSVSGGWNPYLIGGLYGCYVGSFWAVGDIIGGIMCAESAPTHLRASIVGAQTFLVLIGVLLSTILFSVGLLIIPNIHTLCLILMAPPMVASLFVLTRKVGDTKGIDLNTVTGREWD
jgi:Sugar phosphate permease